MGLFVLFYHKIVIYTYTFVLSVHKSIYIYNGALYINLVDENSTATKLKYFFFRILVLFIDCFIINTSRVFIKVVD